MKFLREIGSTPPHYLTRKTILGLVELPRSFQPAFVYILLISRLLMSLFLLQARRVFNTHFSVFNTSPVVIATLPEKFVFSNAKVAV